MVCVCGVTAQSSRSASRDGRRERQCPPSGGLRQKGKFCSESESLLKPLLILERKRNLGKQLFFHLQKEGTRLKIDSMNRLRMIQEQVEKICPGDNLC